MSSSLRRRLEKTSYSGCETSGRSRAWSQLVSESRPLLDNAEERRWMGDWSSLPVSHVEPNFTKACDGSVQFSVMPLCIGFRLNFLAGFQTCLPPNNQLLPPTRTPAPTRAELGFMHHLAFLVLPNTLQLSWDWSWLFCRRSN